MDIDKAVDFAGGQRVGILVTLRADGRPHTSNVVYAVDGHQVRVSLTDDRVKTRNLRGDPRTVLHVSTLDGSGWVALEGTGELSAVTTEPGDATGRALAALYTAIAGQDHPDWDDYFQAMVEEHRLVLTITVTRAYGGGAV
jgi:PPOX class probable F420-dependent enzyme